MKLLQDINKYKKPKGDDSTIRFEKIKYFKHLQMLRYVNQGTASQFLTRMSIPQNFMHFQNLQRKLSIMAYYCVKIEM